jgi:SAM-dependent methyltransferase
MVDRKNTLRKQIIRTAVLGPTLVSAARVVRKYAFPGSREYWERHYRKGGDSGDGSTGALAEFKAEVVNSFVAENDVRSVIEFGCGDGQQLALAKYPRYLGLDVSRSVLRQTVSKFSDDATKSFMLYDPTLYADPAKMMTADLALSLDVIYHLVEDDVYDTYLQHVFGHAWKFVMLYTSDSTSLTVREQLAPHVRHRPVIRDVSERFPQWRLQKKIANRYPYRGSGTGTSFADFYIYERAPLAALRHKVGTAGSDL